MENFNVIEILKFGLPGLIFILSFMSYRLLTQEKQRPKSSKNVLDAIKKFMYFNFMFAILTVIAPVVEHFFFPPDYATSLYKVYTEIGSSRIIEQGRSAICQEKKYGPYQQRYILIEDTETHEMTEVFSGHIVPCQKELIMRINEEDAKLLGWKDGIKTGYVNAVFAPRGYAFPDKPIIPKGN